MDQSDDFYDPLAINLKKQTALLLSQLLVDSPHAQALQCVTTRSELLQTLSELLTVPSLTELVEKLFRPLLLDVCARFLHDQERTEDKLVALCLLLDPHEELFPIFIQFIRQSIPPEGPLLFLLECEDIKNVDARRLHRLLLAYYRLLQANRPLPYNLTWSLVPLSQLIWTPHPDTGVRFLAIRCYALHSGMAEVEREKIEKEVFGELYSVDCQIGFGEDLQGQTKEIDGWVISVVESERVVEARNALVSDPQDYYSVDEGDSTEPMDSSELSPLVANVHGVLLLRSSISPSPQSSLIPTPTAVQSLRSLALYLSMNFPILLSSPPSAGKSLLLSHMASTVHPDVSDQLVSIHLADTSLDPRSLLGSYVSSPTQPGTFEWREGVLVRAMREGRWIVFEDVDRASMEVLGVIKPLVESFGLGTWIGGRAVLDVPSRGRVEADEKFAIFATRSVAQSKSGSDKLPKPTFFGSHKFHEIVVPGPSPLEMEEIVSAKFTRLRGTAAKGLIGLWENIMALGSVSSTREVGLRELEKLCLRVDHLLPGSYRPMDVDVDMSDPDDEKHTTLAAVFPNPTLREEMYLEARDVFFGAGGTTAAAQTHLGAIAALAAEHLGLTPERSDWVLRTRVPEFDVEKDVNGRTMAVCVGRTRLPARQVKAEIAAPVTRPFAMHRPAVLLLSRIATAASLGEPILLTGETGTGKTSVVTHLASLLRRPLVSLNLSHQTESSDLLGGFKPVDVRVPGAELLERFETLFAETFSRKRNVKFEEAVRKAVREGKWKRAVGLWGEAMKLARERLHAKIGSEQTKQSVQQDGDQLDSAAPRKRRKVEQGSPLEKWDNFARSVEQFDVQYVQGKGKFAFGFVEGPLVKALKSGDWMLLDEVNLASPETLECITSLLHSPTGSITLTEQGSLKPVPRHPDFRLFACMNPATDVGKKDLPPNIRSRFTEIDVPSPDADRDTLLAIVAQYIGAHAVGDKAAIMDVAEFYTGVKQLSQSRQISDGSNHRPHYSMRTLARALTFAADMATVLGLRRALWEGCLMAFTMVLNTSSAEAVTALAQKHILSSVRNVRSFLAKEPALLRGKSPEAFMKFGPFYLGRGMLPEDPAEEYIITPSVEVKLIDLARIITTKRFPVLIEGPTSAGKTSSIEYLARRTGHRFVRINNHEHTDIQEYLGTYVSDPVTGRLVFQDGLLVRALRNGDWIVLDELNLAPTDVLEALNRLLDDNRELLIPETQEIVRPHPQFMLFATQNPPGLYAGRKILSRAFRNRFLEVHFDDVPQAELETILCQRCRIAPSYGNRIVSVFRELQKRRQSGRVFESKQGFATLRDLFRWAGRDAVGYKELAENGYMLLAERARREDDKAVVKEVIESIMKVKIDESSLYRLHGPESHLRDYLGCPLPPASRLVWTTAMQRLFVLVSRALRFNEPVLLVGETGTGKTSICQVYAEAVSRHLHAVSCHQNTETADLLGGLRPVRNRATFAAEVVRQASSLLRRFDVADIDADPQSLLACVDKLAVSSRLSEDDLQSLRLIRQKLQRLILIFEWHDGPLVEAMQKGEVFLLDEISLADDSVLERLNSVMEPGRTLVLAEKGSGTSDETCIRAVDGFKLVATMNPGGDYGKKELSPALRNRFTEIWVPAVTERRDLEHIVDSLWQNDTFKKYTGPLLDFVEWLSDHVHDRSIITLRDILAWIDFSNAVTRIIDIAAVHESEIFHHAAHMTYLDGLDSLPQFSTFSEKNIRELKCEAVSRLHELVPFPTEHGSLPGPSYDPSTFVQFGPFAVRRGAYESASHTINLQAPTTFENATRMVRACQVSKPILLEGSPGVGKTSLITALANVCGYKLCRMNLSDQTDLMDLFGSDLPVEGGGPGEFAWKDAEFLKAMQEGSWVLLDEMNLAPQAVLEGLNAVLDHRGAVYIPELARSFTRHPNFRIFAAQNPLSQGGGRKGLPKSFLNRFTKVYVQELSPKDMFYVCQHLFPQYSAETLHAMIRYNALMDDEVKKRGSFAREGAPWQFNLRDIMRWGILMRRPERVEDPVAYLRTLYLHRLRNEVDRKHALSLFEQTFLVDASGVSRSPTASITPSQLQIGYFSSSRNNLFQSAYPRVLLQSQSSMLESAGVATSQSWLVILSGPPNSGKTSLVRLMADMTGNRLQEVAMNSATDTSDILGSFEQVDHLYRLRLILERIVSAVDYLWLNSEGSRSLATKQEHYLVLREAVRSNDSIHPTETVMHSAFAVLEDFDNLGVLKEDQLSSLRQDLRDLMRLPKTTGRFDWINGPLIRAMEEGYWLLLDGANLCSPAVLDRLNSLCEPGGVLTLNERGQTNGDIKLVKPHSRFRLFMTVDPQYGELSRAMRNRGIELAFIRSCSEEDFARLLIFHRLPTVYGMSGGHMDVISERTAKARRGLTYKRLLTANSMRLCASILHHDSTAALMSNTFSLVPFKPSLSAPESEGLLRYYSHIVAPAYLDYIPRLVKTLAYPTQHTHVSNLLSLTTSLGKSTFGIMQELSRDYGLAASVSPDFLLYQPLGTYLTSCMHPSFDSRRPSAQLGFMHMLHLITAVCSNLESRPVLRNADAETGISSAHSNKNWVENVMQKAVKLVDRLTFSGHSVVASLDAESIGARTPDLEVALRLQGYARHLRSIIVAKTFDFSAAHAIVQWIQDVISLRNPDSVGYIELYEDTKALQDLVSPSSGLGLTEIWSAFFLPLQTDIKGAEINDFDAKVCALALRPDIHEIRLHVLEMLALETLPITRDQVETQTFARLRERMQSTLSQNAHESSPCILSSDPITSLVAEMEVLGSRGFATMDKSCHEGPRLVALLRSIMRLCCLDLTAPVSRFLCYQHALWAIDSGKLGQPIAVSIQKRWFEALWTTMSPENVLDGPSMLLRPAVLNATMSQCDWSKTTLSMSDAYSMALTRQMNVAVLQLCRPRSRLQSLGAQIAQSIFTVWSCFSNSSPEATAEWMREFAWVDFETSISEIQSNLDKTDSAHLVAAYRRHLRPSLQALCRPRKSKKDTIASLGHCWIALSKLLIELYVPNTPIDPNALLKCAVEFWEYEEAVALAQFQLLTRLEDRTTGNDCTASIMYIKSSLDRIRARLSTSNASLRSRAHEILRLHAFWAETSQFIGRVLTHDKLDSLIRALEGGDATAIMREKVLQESISGFCQRLETIYPEFHDISGAVHLALLQLKFGLRLLTESGMRQTAPDDGFILEAGLIAFPSIKSASILGGELALPGVLHNSGFLSPLLKLAAVSVDISAGADLESRIPLIDVVYEQLIQFWLKDKAVEEQAERESQSLYKSKKIDHDAPIDTEADEQEFLQLFPTYEESTDHSDRPFQSNNLPIRLTEVSQPLFTLHMSLFMHQHSSNTFGKPCDQFRSLRKMLLKATLVSQLSHLPEGLDQESLAYQIRLLDEQVAFLHDTSRAFRSHYDFYHDPNIPEGRKASRIVAGLRSRLVQLVREWPDQMVLQHLKSRCDDVLALNLSSPVAKMLSSIEQLLLQTDDWEMYSNRSNTLKDHRRSLTALIVDWRRLELSCWQQLLEGQALNFAKEIGTWWFRLYDALVRGGLAAADEEAQGCEHNIDHYLDNLNPLLDEFLTSSPMGQYRSRLDLLGSFEIYAAHLSAHNQGIRRSLLLRLQNLLHSTVFYYGQYAETVSTSISQQRAPLEKEFRDFIKLASWKDINVQALKQSAQRTHKHLYRVMRKFRDMLRQTVIEHLRPITAGDAETKIDEVNEGPPFVETPYRPSLITLAQQSTPTPAYRLNLERTYKRYTALMRDSVEPLTRARSAVDVENLATDIIVTAREFARLAIPTHLDAAKRAKQGKSLLVRKRKAFSDLLKELKRVGFTPNNRAEILRRQQNLRWIREQPIIEHARDLYVVEKSESYFRRLNAILPDLRESLAGHHSDLTTHELQRGVGFLESAYAMALDARVCLAKLSRQHRKLNLLSRRVHKILSSQRIYGSGHDFGKSVIHVKDSLYRITHALGELYEELQRAGRVQEHPGVPESVLTEVSSLARTSRAFSARILEVADEVLSTSFPVLLQDEKSLVDECCHHMTGISSRLGRLSDAEPHLTYLLQPMQAWLNSQTLGSIERYQSTDEPGQGTASIIDTLLVLVQNVLRHRSDDSDDRPDPDGYIRNHTRFMCDLTRSLDTDKVLQAANLMLVCLSSADEDNGPELKSAQPFLDQYVNIVEVQLVRLSDWTRSLFKLLYVTCSVFRTIAQQGFCRPPEGEDERGEGAEVDHGMGLGEGEGIKDVTEEIEDESQMEGLQGEDAGDNSDKTKEADNAMEMAGDIEGDLQSLPDDVSNDDEASDQDDPEDIEERVADVDSSDSSAVDEKLWGDEEGPEGEDHSERRAKDDHSTEAGADSEVAAKDRERPQDNETASQTQDVASPSLDNPEEETPPDEGDSGQMEDQTPNEAGTPIDDHVKESDTLDLPDDMDLTPEPNGAQDGRITENGSDVSSDVEEEDVDENRSIGSGAQDEVEGATGNERESVDASEGNDFGSENDIEDATAQPDIGPGDGTSHMQQGSAEADITPEARTSMNGEDNAEVSGTEEQGSTGKDGQRGAVEMSHPPAGDANETSQPMDSNEEVEGQAPSSSETRGGSSPSQPLHQLSNNPLRSLGDALKEISRRTTEIEESVGQLGESSELPSNAAENSAVEYLRPDEPSSDMQALGPAREEQTARLSDLHITDDRHTEESDIPMEVDDSQAHGIEPVDHSSPLEGRRMADALQMDMDNAITRAQVDSRDASQLSAMGTEASGRKMDQDLGIDVTDEGTEVRLRQWQQNGLPEEGAEQLWRSYESITHDLSYALCEQLRLILEPTQATRLRGDYRTGKRLNMKKIIPYIASEYTKDKIWLRRTRPSQREYQVLIALDDSRSMAESHSVHLAFQTMALVSKALGKLEVGDVGIAKFGETVDVLHGFDAGPFTDQAGTRVMSAFKFNQKATNVLSLVETSLKVLEEAREKRAMSSKSAADLWQLEIIISDGICQDHERLRTVLRKAEESRVMVVFVIVDSLHSHSQNTGSEGPNHNSILSMTQVAYKNVGGRMELQMERYLDSFPFEYYVVLRNVEALPDVLAGTLKQFFERVSEE